MGVISMNRHPQAIGPNPGSMKSLGRAVKKLFKYYPIMAPLTFLCILLSAFISAIPSLFVQNVLAVIEKYVSSGDWTAAKPEVFHYILILGVLYLLSLIATVIETQLMAVMTQGYLNKLREEMFDGMQTLPIKYFDTHKHGDIMSYYTNDIDTLRQFVSQSLPTFLRAGTIVLVCIAIMLYFSIYLALVPFIGVIAMILVAKKIGGGSAKYFLEMQKNIGKTEGFIQEMMSGQRVIKVFSHEQQSIADFDKYNEDLYEVSYKANAYANTMGPIFGNIGNILYVVTAFLGGVLMLIGVKNISISQMALDITVLIPFLNMTKQFTGNCNQLSQQINSIVMASAGATRLFSLLDESSEVDDGYVTLVNATIEKDGIIKESTERTGKWAWKHPHGDGTITYTELKGDVQLVNVDFGYVEGTDILHDISVYANPGQKVAFVGATGAGKTTITNLINRFYDIADGKIRYDGININKIKKSDLRRSLGLVLQDTNLFTGTVLENIRYGRLDATDEECIAAAKITGADSFISRLPNGYETELSNNGSNLSQGQRQLLAIARAAVADPPVMILDEATSSIDTRTEAIVQKGMDKLMENRTVFVIAHRLSTIMDADVIMVLDHGRIIERGNHEQLLSEKGTYYQLYTGSFEQE